MKQTRRIDDAFALYRTIPLVRIYRSDALDKFLGWLVVMDLDVVNNQVGCSKDTRRVENRRHPDLSTTEDLILPCRESRIDLGTAQHAATEHSHHICRLGVREKKSFSISALSGTPMGNGANGSNHPTLYTPSKTNRSR